MAKSNVAVNNASEAKCFYSDTDASGQILDGSGRYTVSFPKDRLSPGKGLRSLTVYNAHHFFTQPTEPPCAG
ncbi:DUF1214 domain-containing protein [Paraburkholderia sp. USG1]|uniref:DUF1214 domain-containing protein n=1 Tax=Paraburkholderia sp. USG1 TaxID=2952268 RepID=UPI000A059DDD